MLSPTILTSATIGSAQGAAQSVRARVDAADADVFAAPADAGFAPKKARPGTPTLSSAGGFPSLSGTDSATLFQAQSLGQEDGFSQNTEDQPQSHSENRERPSAPVILGAPAPEGFAADAWVSPRDTSGTSGFGVSGVQAYIRTQNATSPTIENGVTTRLGSATLYDLEI